MKNRYKDTKQKVRRPLSVQMQRRLHEGWFLICIMCALFLLIALLTYHVNDPGWSSSGGLSIKAANSGGRVGAWVADVMLSLFGLMAYLFPILMVLASWIRLKEPELASHRWHDQITTILGWFFLIVSSAALAHFYLTIKLPLPAATGGIVGDLVATGLAALFNRLGSTLLLLALFLCGITWVTGLSWLGLIDAMGRASVRSVKQWLKQLAAGPHALFAALFAALWRKSAMLAATLHGKPSLGPKKSSSGKLTLQKSPPSHLEPKLDTAVQLKAPVIEPKLDAAVQLKTSIVEPKLDTIVQPKTPIYEPKLETMAQPKTPAVVIDRLKPQMSVSDPIKPSIELKEAKRELLVNPVKKSVDKNRGPSKSETFKPANKNWLPELGLLNEPPVSQDQPAVVFFTDLSELVEQRLADFGVTVKVVAVHPGPVITRFELDLAPGIKVSKITGLAKDIARALSTVSVRIVEVIPGKSVIGLEIPNENRELVTLREMLESSRYAQSDSPMTLVLGKDIAGYPVVVDLAKMPHLLVAGTTGSGKSVSLNAMLLSMLYKSTPAELRFIMIDPKMLELSIYDGIPHLLTPVITDMKHAANALRWCVGEMDKRYRLMAALGVRNLASYNQQVNDAIKQNTPLPQPSSLVTDAESAKAHLVPLPVIVVIVDEFADMMMVVGKKVEDLIARIAQKARAAGIHLILATQRPSVDVITGLIKANIPTRIAFQVSSRIDSRTILDQQGAEQLLGHGDMLYLPPGAGVPTRVHGAYVADEEVHRVVKAWRQFGEPDYLYEVTDSTEELVAGHEEEAGEQDAFYDEAVRIVVESRRASISLIQRRLRIGYNRAARMMEKMEARGIVSAMDANGSREVLIKEAAD